MGPHVTGQVSLLGAGVVTVGTPERTHSWVTHTHTHTQRGQYTKRQTTSSIDREFQEYPTNHEYHCSLIFVNPSNYSSIPFGQRKLIFLTLSAFLKDPPDGVEEEQLSAQGSPVCFRMCWM